MPALLVSVLAAVTTAGCAGVRLHNAAASDVADSIKSRYEAADVLGIVEVQRANLAALSAEESRVVRENFQLQRDFALLEIVDGDWPMGRTWNNDMEGPVEKLGFESAAALRRYIQGVDVHTKVRGRQLERLARAIREATRVVVPECTRSSPLAPVDDIGWPDGLDPTALNLARTRYGLYVEACSKRLADMDQEEGGALRQARTQWEQARKDLEAHRSAVAKAGKEVKNAQGAHAAATREAAAAGKKGAELRAAIGKSADNMKDKIQSASKIAPSVVTGERIEAIVTLLEAAASEDTDLAAGDQPDEDLADAVLLVNGVTSLSADLAGLVAEARAPTVSNLLIELQHQTVLLEHERGREALQRERVNILEAKYLARVEEAGVLLELRDAMCSFGTLTAEQPHPGDACDEFSVSEDEKTCSQDGAALAGCGLSKPWKDHLRSPPAGNAGRELYKSLTALNRLFPVRARQVELDFKLVDLKHRENLAERELALKAWNNLAAVPIEQLDAYFASGLKPAEIADLLVKALGFTAITVGVSQ